MAQITHQLQQQATAKLPALPAPSTTPEPTATPAAPSKPWYAPKAYRGRR